MDCINKANVDLSPAAFDPKRWGVVIPTFNAASHWMRLREAIDSQGVLPAQVLIIDSSSSDGTSKLAEEAGYRVILIPQSDFSHGGTRQLGCTQMPWAELLIYLTQDALPSGGSAFRALCSVFADPKMGAACGRQLPRLGANAIERHARLFNYPASSAVRTFADRERLGIKTAFLSNSFAAYRRAALEEVGGFPKQVIMAEDSVVAARMLMKGWKVAYVAEAVVTHSHGLSVREEFHRYFDTGVHHSRENWIRRSFGHAGKEGSRFFRSEVSYLRAEEPHLILLAIIRTGTKLLAYHLGLREKYLPRAVKRVLSLQPRFWSKSRSRQTEEHMGV